MPSRVLPKCALPSGTALTSPNQTAPSRSLNVVESLLLQRECLIAVPTSKKSNSIGKSTQSVLLVSYRQQQDLSSDMLFILPTKILYFSPFKISFSIASFTSMSFLTTTWERGLSSCSFSETWEPQAPVTYYIWEEQGKRHLFLDIARHINDAKMFSSQHKKKQCTLYSINISYSVRKKCIVPDTFFFLIDWSIVIVFYIIY